jgi:hypothetical protein
MRVGAPPAVERGDDRCGIVVLLLGSVKAFHHSAVQQRGVALHNVSLDQHYQRSSQPIVPEE